MRELSIYELLSEVVSGMSKSLNKKALREVIERYEVYDYDNELNELLFNYYNRVHRSKRDDVMIEFFKIENDEDLQYLKDNYNVKRYKTAYDYKSLTPIRQKDTRYGFITHYPLMSRFSYAFNVYEYVKLNKIKLREDF